MRKGVFNDALEASELGSSRWQGAEGLLLKREDMGYVLREGLQRVVLIQLVFLLARIVIVEHRLLNRDRSAHVEVGRG